MKRPEVQAEKPEDKEKDNYQMLTVNGIDVYIADNMSRENKNIKLTIDAVGFWIMKKLYLSKIEEF